MDLIPDFAHVRVTRQVAWRGITRLGAVLVAMPTVWAVMTYITLASVLAAMYGIERATGIKVTPRDDWGIGCTGMPAGLSHLECSTKTVPLQRSMADL